MYFRIRLIPLHSDPTGTAPAVATPPAAVPSTPAAEAPVETGNTDFEALSREIEADNLHEEPSGEPETPPAPTTVATTVSPAVTPPVAVSTPPVAAASPPVAPVAAAPQPAVPPATPQVPPAQPAPAAVPDDGRVTPEKVEAAYKQFEAQLLPQLEQQYKLTPEQVTQLEENAPAFIPKMMAKLHYQVQIAAYTGVMSQMPRVIEQILTQHKAVDTAVGKFYNRWPDLKDAKHDTAVDQGLKAWRNANPNATMDDMIEKAGLMLMLSLGLGPNLQQQQQGQQSVTPNTPVRPAGVAGAGPIAKPAGGAVNVFEAMAEDIMRGEI